MELLPPLVGRDGVCRRVSPAERLHGCVSGARILLTGGRPLSAGAVILSDAGLHACSYSGVRFPSCRSTRSWICFALPPLRDSCQEYGCQYFDLDPGQKASLAAPYDFLAED